MHLSSISSLIWLAFFYQPVFSTPAPLNVDTLTPHDGFLTVNTRLSKEEVQAMRRELASPPGTILNYVSLSIDPDA